MPRKRGRDTDRQVGGTATAEALSCTFTSFGCWFQFIDALFGSLEMVGMQSGVDVGARAGTGEGVLNVRGRYTGIHIPQTLVRYVHLPCLLQFREQTE